MRSIRTKGAKSPNSGVGLRRRIKRISTRLLLLGVIVVLGGWFFAYAGIFDIAADEPHSAPVYAYMELVRTRSIAVRARDLDVPALDSPSLIETGAQHYEAMCSGCHLAPGRSDTEIRMGLYPKPPNLTQHRHGSPAETFWIIKHGIKMSGMPAWGATHDDEAIWGIVAFVEKLPEMSAQEYQKAARPTHEVPHSHASGAEAHHDEKSAPAHKADSSSHPGERADPAHHK